MSTITLQNFRVGSDLTVKVRLKDGGVAIDWSTLSGIRAVLYSDAQSSIAGRCDVTVDGEDPTLLMCRYAATKMQYLGVNRIVVSAKYMGMTKTYDKPAFTFVRWTEDQAGEEITIEDPEVTVEIDVEDVSSSILQEAVDAAFSAADRANEAAAAAEHMVDIHTGPEGKSAYEVAVEEGYTGTEEEWLASLKGPVGETPDISIGTVTTVEPGEPAAASMGGTPEAPVLNLSIPKGLVGATPNITVGTVTTGQPGTPVVVTITGTPEAPVLNVTIPQGMQGNTGSSVEYPYELVNNLTTNDATKGLSAAQGVVLDGKISQLEAEVHNLSGKYYGLFADESDLPEGDAVGYAFVGTEAPFAIWNFDGEDWADSGATATDIYGEPGVGFESAESHTPADGTVEITLTNGDNLILDLNHNHPQYPKYVVCDDLLEYIDIATKDSGTLYLIPGVAIYLGDTLILNQRTPQYDAVIEYLESTGTQYINTGIVAASNFKCEIKGSFTQNDGNYDCVIGSSDVSTTPSKYSVVFGLLPANSPYVQIGAEYATGTGDILTLHTFITEKSGNALSISVDGTTSTATYSGSNPMTTLPLVVFARKKPDEIGNFSKFKLYYLKIWNDGVLVRNYIPVRVGQVGYLYDAVSDTLFGNDGSGNFTLGADKQ